MPSRRSRRCNSAPASSRRPSVSRVAHFVFMGSRVDHRVELGNAQLVLGRALLEQGKLDEADETFAQAEHTLDRAAIGERASVWLAQGESATRRGDTTTAAELYRRAAEALQDFHF